MKFTPVRGFICALLLRYCKHNRGKTDLRMNIDLIEKMARERDCNEFVWIDPREN